MVIFTYEDYCKYRRIYPNKLCEESATYTKETIKDKHDKLYRDFLSDPFEFSQIIKHFLKKEIPQKELINYNNAFITEDYKNRRSDVVYKIKDQPIYLFLEHQSSIDHSINYRILDYYYYILKSTVDTTKLKNKNYKFPIIIPILLYTGGKNWDHVANIGDKQENTENKYFSSKKLDIPYEFINIHNYTIEELLDINTMTSYAMAIDKTKTKEELLGVLYELTNRITKETKKDHIKRLINYIYEDFLEESIKQKLIQKLNEKEETDMKYAWDYVREDILRERRKERQEGIKEGRQEGKREGFLEGTRKKTKEITQEMLKQNISVETIKKVMKLSEEEFNQIKKELKMV